MKPLTALYQNRTLSGLQVRHQRVPGTTGSRVVLVSDIHARDDWFSRPCVVELVAAINRVERVDAVLLLGDYVGDDVRAIDWAAEELGHLTAPTYAVLGNHDHWTDSERVTRALRRNKVDVLTNASSQLDTGLWLAGIDSCWDGDPDPERAFHRIPDDEPTVVLGHEPFLATMHQRYLHVAGHTHHGQIRIPPFAEFLARRTYPEYSQPYPRGLYHRAPQSWVYTTAGVGFSTVSIRFNCPPEIVVLDL